MYSRVVDGKTLTFGVSGKLWKNALVMYDRETSSLWSHLTGECIEGHYEGKALEMLASTPIVRWKVWKENYPDTKVLTVQGREEQRRDNYRDYHGSSRTGLFPTEHKDKRFHNKELVIGVHVKGSSKAYPTQKSRWETGKHGVWNLVEDDVGGVPLLVYHDPDNFTSAVYSRQVGTETLTFEDQAEGYFTRDAGGGRWNLLTGTGSDGSRLTPIPHLNVYWFAWVDFYPNADLFEQKD